jgi:hypothetical protein
VPARKTLDDTNAASPCPYRHVHLHVIGAAGRRPAVTLAGRLFQRTVLPARPYV